MKTTPIHPERDAATSALLLGIFLLSLLVFMGGLGQRDIVTSHEARVAQTARIMKASGAPGNAQLLSVARPVLVEKHGRKMLVDSDTTIEVNPWIVPVLNDQIRLNKPPLPYWMTAFSYAIFGLNEFAARFPTALLGALAPLLMFQIGRHLFDRRVGFIAAMLWLSTHFIVDEFRRSMADPYLAFFALLAIVSFLQGGRWILVCWIGLALGAMAKGPVIFVTTIPAFVILWKWSKQSRSNIAWHLFGLIAFLAIVLPWPIAVMKQIPNARELWQYDAFESQEKARPLWMYFANLFQLTLPWTPFWIASLVLAFLHRRRGVRTKRRWALILWMLLIAILFSIKPVKKNAYLLPLMPALLLSTAEAIATMLCILRRDRKRSVAWVLMTILAAIGIGFGCAIAGFCVRSYPNRVLGIIAAIVAVLASLSPLITILRGNHRRWFFAQATSFGLLLAMFLSTWFASADNVRSPAAMAQSVLSLSKREQIPIALAPSPEEMSFYLPLHLPYWKHSDRVLLILDKPSALELADRNFIQDRFDHAMVTSWGVVLRDPRYVVVEVLLNRDRI